MTQATNVDTCERPVYKKQKEGNSVDFTHKTLKNNFALENARTTTGEDGSEVFEV